MAFKHVCSLGPNCLPGCFLKSLSIKKHSYPFDWVFSTPAIIRECIDDNFATFLDRSCYIDHSRKIITKAGHTKYCKDMFEHHNPRMDDDYRYFERCVGRFRELYKNSEPKLFLLVVNTDNFKRDAFYKDVQILNEYLRSRIQNYSICVIFAKQNRDISCKQDPTYVYKTEDNIHVFDVSLRSTLKGITFGDESDSDFIKSIIRTHFEFDVGDV